MRLRCLPTSRQSIVPTATFSPSSKKPENINKRRIYHESARRLNVNPGEIAVYEDALYAVQTAKAAGYYVVGVYDDSAADSWQAIEEMADEIIIKWEEAL